MGNRKDPSAGTVTAEIETELANCMEIISQHSLITMPAHFMIADVMQFYNV